MAPSYRFLDTQPRSGCKVTRRLSRPRHTKRLYIHGCNFGVGSRAMWRCGPHGTHPRQFWGLSGTRIVRKKHQSYVTYWSRAMNYYGNISYVCPRKNDRVTKPSGLTMNLAVHRPVTATAYILQGCIGVGRSHASSARSREVVHSSRGLRTWRKYRSTVRRTHTSPCDAFFIRCECSLRT